VEARKKCTHRKRLSFSLADYCKSTIFCFCLQDKYIQIYPKYNAVSLHIIGLSLFFKPLLKLPVAENLIKPTIHSFHRYGYLETLFNTDGIELEIMGKGDFFGILFHSR
jgi:hypothetical protein